MTEMKIEIPNLIEIDDAPRKKDKKVKIKCVVCGRIVTRSYYVVIESIKRNRYTGKCADCSYATHKRIAPSERTKRLNTCGYELVPVKFDSPFAPMRNKTGRVMIHRLIMAQHLGRCLEASEIVHHKNGDKLDNRIENLIITTNSEHSKGHQVGYQDGFEEGYKDGLKAADQKVLAEKDKEIERLEKELERLKSKTWCAYCGQEYPLDTVTAEQIGEHINTCEKHPLFQARKALAEEKRKVAEEIFHTLDMFTTSQGIVRMFPHTYSEFKAKYLAPKVGDTREE